MTPTGLPASTRWTRRADIPDGVPCGVLLDTHRSAAGNARVVAGAAEAVTPEDATRWALTALATGETLAIRLLEDRHRLMAEAIRAGATWAQIVEAVTSQPNAALSEALFEEFLTALPDAVTDGEWESEVRQRLILAAAHPYPKSWPQHPPGGVT